MARAAESANEAVRLLGPEFGSKIKDCGDATSGYAKMLDDVLSVTNGRRYMACVSSHRSLKQLALLAVDNTKAKERLILCDRNQNSNVGVPMIFGRDMPTKSSALKNSMLISILVAENLELDEAREIAKCCGENPAEKSCSILKSLDSIELRSPELTLRRLYRSALAVGVPRTRVLKFNTRVEELRAKIETPNKHLTPEQLHNFRYSVLELCKKQLSEANCESSLNKDRWGYVAAVSESNQVPSQVQGAAPAKSSSEGSPVAGRIVAALDSVSSERTTDAAPASNRTIVRRADSPDTTDRDFRRFEQGGPVATGLVNVSRAVFNQVVPTASARTNTPVELHQFGSANINGVPILEGTVNGEKKYVAVSVPFSKKGKVGTPIIATGSTPDSVRAAYLSAAQSGVDSDSGNQNGRRSKIGSTGRQASDSNAATDTSISRNQPRTAGGSSSSASSGVIQASTSDQTQESVSANSPSLAQYTACAVSQPSKCIGSFNRDLGSSVDPANFLKQAQQVLIRYRLKYHCQGADYPSGDTGYVPLHEYDCSLFRRRISR